jgi:xylulokinase
MIARLTGAADPRALLETVAASYRGPGRLLMLPYLAGERTPHDDPWASGVIMGLSSDSTAADLALAALEAVAFSLADGRDALAEAGIAIDSAGFIGGGARSRLWGQIAASVLGIPLETYAGGARGPAYGAARLARLALGEPPESVLTLPAVAEIMQPDAVLAAAYAPRLDSFRHLYQALRPEFARDRAQAMTATTEMGTSG